MTTSSSSASAADSVSMHSAAVALLYVQLHNHHPNMGVDGRSVVVLHMLQLAFSIARMNVCEVVVRSSRAGVNEWIQNQQPAAGNRNGEEQEERVQLHCSSS